MVALVDQTDEGKFQPLAELHHVHRVLAHLFLEVRTAKVIDNVLEKTEINEAKVEIEVNKDFFDGLGFLESVIFFFHKFLMLGFD